jgi:hypothetical protein
MLAWDARLHLFNIEELEQLPDGIELKSVNGSIKVKGKDSIDTDVRYGYTAWGVEDPWNHPLKDLFLIFKLKE